MKNGVFSGLALSVVLAAFPVLSETVAEGAHAGNNDKEQAMSASNDTGNGAHAWLRKLIPTPKSVTPGEGVCSVPVARGIHVAKAADPAAGEEDWFAASLLAGDIAEITGVEVPVTHLASRGRLPYGIVLARTGLSAEADKRMMDAGLATGPDFNAEGYVLLADSKGILVCADTPAGLFYGVQTLRQLIRAGEADSVTVPAVSIRDYPSMQFRGVQNDVNRGPVPTLESMKRHVRLAAEYKLNVYSLYMEHLFESESHAVINPYGGTLPRAEMNELCAYARQYHVDIVPQQQTFGHLHYVLRKEQYADLGERPYSHVLRPGHEPTYDFLQSFLAETVPSFPSPWFHIGADETFELGLGASAARVEEEGKAAVYAQHLGRVHEIMKPYGKRLMFWAEAIVAHPELAEMVLTDMVAVAWGYHVAANYDVLIKPWADAGFDTIVAPSTLFGGNLYPDNDEHFQNVRNMARDGIRHGSLGMLNTTWIDLGDAFFDTGWYGLLYGAAASWQEDTPVEPFHAAYDWAFHRNDESTVFADANKRLGDAEAAFRTKHGARLDSGIFFVNPFSELGGYALSPITPELASGIRAGAGQTINELHKHRGLARRNADQLEFLSFEAARIDYVGRKVQVAREVRGLYRSWQEPLEGENTQWNVYDMLAPYAGRLPDIRDGAMELMQWHEDLWMSVNRQYFWPINRSRYEKLMQDYLDQEERLTVANQRLARGQKTPAEESGFFIE